MKRYEVILIDVLTHERVADWRGARGPFRRMPQARAEAAEMNLLLHYQDRKDVQYVVRKIVK